MDGGSQKEVSSVRKKKRLWNGDLHIWALTTYWAFGRPPSMVGAHETTATFLNLNSPGLLPPCSADCVRVTMKSDGKVTEIRSYLDESRFFFGLDIKKICQRMRMFNWNSNLQLGPLKIEKDRNQEKRSLKGFKRGLEEFGKDKNFKRENEI